ncbi:putative WD repeat-containing protein alr2800 [Planktothrix agardhii]|uniref:Similar to tr/Q10XF7/Q10XF7_TRIEI ATPase n=1 Tax=Planktothrix agardhii TaxID=1160 RepID=A0A1J1JBD2_PLAAG|nr:NB-ARC domain-containing protein [Planktothrix agardhii]CAD5966823.1 putative WD repeat-containing protein alr2800 [Planktothrix agardhii]CUM58776.1 Similar to tr/Q10XF7/Q10XF7_TRIEI ATPase [Planktothrix agardhii]
MTVTEALQLANELVFAQTGKHLDDLQEEVIKGLWQGQTYNKIAEESNRSESRVKDIGHKLLHILSEQLGEDVKKSNFRSTIERLKVTSSPSSQVGINQNFNFCSQSFHNNTKELLSDKLSNTSTVFHDLTIAPKITYFYDRTTELNTLSHWLIDQNTRLTSVLGLSGIGKTTLVKQFVDLNLQHFDIIIWKNIKLSPSLDSILTEILTHINPDSILADNKLTQTLNLFRDQKCLIILDDVQELFIKEKSAGQYKSEYRDYQPFLTMITETEHQSSLILISQEKCQEMISLDEELYPVQCLELEGLDSIDILKNYGLQDQESWSTLIQLYDGNPVCLKDIAGLIKKIFSGKVSEFLKENSLILTESIQSRLSQLFERLSPIEQQIIIELSQDNHPVSREDLRERLSLSSMDLINGLDSLMRRYLIKIIESDQVLFGLSFIIREYIKVRCNQQN